MQHLTFGQFLATLHVSQSVKYATKTSDYDRRLLRISEKEDRLSMNMIWNPNLALQLFHTAPCPHRLWHLQSYFSIVFRVEIIFRITIALRIKAIIWDVALVAGRTVQSIIQPLAIESSVLYISNFASWLIVGFLKTELFTSFAGHQLVTPVVWLDYPFFVAGALLLRLLIHAFSGKCSAVLLLQDQGTFPERVIVRPDWLVFKNQFTRRPARMIRIILVLIRFFRH